MYASLSLHYSSGTDCKSQSIIHVIHIQFINCLETSCTSVVVVSFIHMAI